MGAPINAVAGKGYHLDHASGLLSFQPPASLGQLHYAHHMITQSTNDDVLRLARVCRQAYLVSSDYQAQGRGRRGTAWTGAFGLDLALTYGSALDGPEGMQPYSVILGAAIADWLRSEFDLNTMGVKWPNDVWVNGKKLAGILVELHTLQGQLYMLTGVGMNVNSRRDGDSVSLRDLLGKPVSREAVTQGLAACLAGVHAGSYTHTWRDLWRAHDVLSGRTISLVQGDTLVRGTALGVDKAGSLKVEVDGVMRHYNGGIVRVRPT